MGNSAFDVVFRYFWVAAILTSIPNYFALKRRVDARAGTDPELRALGQKLVVWMLGLMTAPWVVLGAGTLVGSVSSVREVFRPQDGNPWVAGFLALLPHLPRRPTGIGA